MDASLFNLIVIILLLGGIAGTFLPVLPGLLLSLCGLLLYKFGGEAPLGMVYVWFLVFLIITATILNYIIPAKTTQKYGGTRWGSVGSFLGTILGMLFIPVPFGFLIGMLAGVFIGEILHDAKDTHKAFRSVKGSFIGFFLGTGFSFTVAVAILLVVVGNMFNFI